MTAIRLTNADVEIETAPWPHKPMTFKRSVAILGWWVMCVIMPPLAIVMGAMFGAITGLGAGAYKGLSEAYADLRRWWQMFEES